MLTTKQTLFVSLTQEQVWLENSIDPTHPTKDRRKAKVRGKFKLPKSKFGNGETIENVIETLNSLRMAFSGVGWVGWASNGVYYSIVFFRPTI